MQTKITSTSKLHPPASCKLCGANARVIKQLTFSYFFCDRCKDECDVWLKTETHPKAMKGQYVATMPNDVVIDKPGVYRIVYLNGDVEWYEHSSGYNASPLRLNGEAISSATRCSDSDLPSRKPVSLAQGTDQGTKGEEPCLGTVPDPKAGFSRSSAQPDADQTAVCLGGNVPDKIVRYFGANGGIKKWSRGPDGFYSVEEIGGSRWRGSPKFVEFLADDWFASNPIKAALSDSRSCGGMLFPKGALHAVPLMAESNQCVQYWTLPPDDEV